MSRLIKSIYQIFSIFLLIISVVVISFSILIFNYCKDLPNYKQLSDYTPALITRFYSANDKLISEQATEHRIFTQIENIPKIVINAFLSAEDKNFYEHSGLDITSIVRALIKNLANIGSKKSLVGGSTITQQVVKNFLLTSEQSYSRKIKEAILSFRINQAYSKDKILELYLNQIYLGYKSYGVAYAAINYFNKNLSDLTLAEAAFLAALPKAPSNYDPKKYYDRAFARRNWVIEKMLENSFISVKEAKEAINTPINLDQKNYDNMPKIDSFSESVRREILSLYGAKNLYEAGLSVHTTLDLELQKIAEKSFRNGIINYDKKQGYRGVIKNSKYDNWHDNLYNSPDYKYIHPWVGAIITNIDSNHLKIETEYGNLGVVNLSSSLWVKNQFKDFREIFKKNDIIIVERINNESDNYIIRQLPKVDGGFVAIEPSTGRVLAMIGGFNKDSEFNRVIQAKRQPGSVFKPFVYLSALENGFTPCSIITDGPIEIYQGPNLPLWRPKNYSGDFLGPTTLRQGLEKSRNTMTVRLGQALGIKKIVEITKRFNINANPPRNFSIVLGAAETSLLNITNAFAMIVNGGKKVNPYQIEYIQDNNGVVIYRNGNNICKNCNITDDTDIFSFIQPEINDDKEQITDPKIAYQMINLLEGVVKRGTARSASILGDNIGGKTGTTNDSNDAWFIGFSHDLVVGTYVGYDSPKTLGKRETGATVALPIFIEFMKDALSIKKNKNFEIPNGIEIIKIDANSGKKTDIEGNNNIDEIFTEGTRPNEDRDILDANNIDIENIDDSNIIFE